MKLDIITYIDKLPNNILFKAYLYLNGDTKNKQTKLDHKLLEESYIQVKDMLSRKENIETPKNNESAVVLAKIYHNIDLYNQKEPLLVYHKMIDNPHYRDTLKKFNCKFNPKLPKCFYDDVTIKHLASDLGFTNKEININDAYRLCLEAQHLNQFNHGRRKKRINEITHIYLTPLLDLNYHMCLSFGLKERCYVYTYEELLLIFSKYLDLTPPNKNDGISFTSRDIRRLLILCSHNQYLGESKKNFNIRRFLGSKIKQILSSRRKISSVEKKLIIYTKENGKEIIKTALQLFTDTVMYMRSWRGPPNDYPLIDTETLVDDAKRIEDAVDSSLRKFNEHISQYNIKDIILELPLYRFENCIYVRNLDKNKGLNIKDRLNIIENPNNQEACIRTSSNWLLASISKIYYLIGVPPPFDIHKMRIIA